MAFGGLTPCPMRLRYIALAFVLSHSVPALAQPSLEAEVPVRRVALFSSGVGFYEHAGPVRGDAEVVLHFSEAALNDVLKSLVVEDRVTRNRSRNNLRIIIVSTPAEEAVQLGFGF